MVVDLGCGNGAFLAAIATGFPLWNCLGIEKKEYRVRQSARRVGAMYHARVWHGEIDEMVRGLVPGCISRAYLLFSDPWPKRRHAVRRLVQPRFADVLASRMERGGTLFFASDSADYATESAGVFAAAGWIVADWIVPEDWPMTEFEQRFRGRGVPVHRFQASP